MRSVPPVSTRMPHTTVSTMSRTDPGDEPMALIRGRLPAFRLEFYYDDQEYPTEVTVCSATDRGTLATHWITIDIDHAVPLDDIR